MPSQLISFLNIYPHIIFSAVAAQNFCHKILFFLSQNNYNIFYRFMHKNPFHLKVLWVFIAVVYNQNSESVIILNSSFVMSPKGFSGVITTHLNSSSVIQLFLYDTFHQSTLFTPLLIFIKCLFDCIYFIFYFHKFYTYFSLMFA